MENGKKASVQTRRLTNAHTDAYGDATLVRTGSVTDALNRLKAYEDTGLSPEEIQERGKEIERLKASLSACQNAETSERRIMRGRVDMKPIIFSTPMVKAILDGDKTMTRRVIKGLLPEEIEAMGKRLGYCDNWWKSTSVALNAPCSVGDILWVRESWAKINGSFVYRADDNAVAFFKRAGIAVKWRPSIHMPKEAARIFLRVTKVSVERAQDIADSDAIDEGMLSYHGWETPEYLAAVEKAKRDGTEPPLGFTPRERFAYIWDSLRKPADIKQYGWDANPWVWVISFERTEANGG